jgi:hypothetical protein
LANSRDRTEVLIVDDETIKALGAALDMRDSETEHHCLRVASFVLKPAPNFCSTLSFKPFPGGEL